MRRALCSFGSADRRRAPVAGDLPPTRNLQGVALVGPLLAAIFVAGVALGAATTVQFGTAAALAIGTAALGIGVRDGPRWRLTLTIACLCSIGACHGAVGRTRALASPLVQWFDLVTAGEPRVSDVVELDGRLTADAAIVEGGVRLTMNVLRVGRQGAWHPVTGRVQALVAGELASSRVKEWTAGRPLRAPATLRRPQVWRNFGGPGERWQQLQRPFDLAATIKSGALVTVERGAVWHEMAAAVRWHVRRAVERTIGPRDRIAAAIATAILIGDRASLDADVIQRLQIAGTYHVVAISGGNVALLTAVCFFGLRVLVRSARPVALLALAVVLAYGWIVGGQPSVARAVLAASLLLLVSAAGLRPRAFHALATVAALLAIVDPLMTIDVGAWLSFGATLGIVVGATRLGGALDGAIGARIRWRMLRSLARICIGSLAATLAAELVLMPISAAVFNRVSLAGLILNFVAIPAMAVVQCAGCAVVVLEAFGPIADVMARVVVISSRALVDSARLVDWAPFLAWRVPPVPLWWTAGYFAAWALVLWPSAHRVRIVAAAAGGVALLVIAWSPAVVRISGAPGALRMTVIDVGQGDAVLVQLPSGRSLLVDSGGAPTSGFDIGSRIVTPAVWAQGATRIDWLAITHPDQDHGGGAPSVIADLLPREIWEGVPVPANALRAAVRQAAVARGLVWREVRAGEGLEADGVRLEMLHPPPPDWERQRVRNDDSMVLRLRYGDVEILLTGDAGTEFESSLPAMPAGAAPPIRVLKAAHHGSRTSSSERFVRTYAPHVVLISAGRGNLFGHPSREVLERFRDVGAEVFRTDLDGAVTLETDGRVVRVRAHRGRTWTVGVWRVS